MKKVSDQAASKKTEASQADELRQQAETLYRQQNPEQSLPKTHSDLQRLVYELGVRQIELETQNEELRQTQLDLETVSSRYVDLFDFAPVGYLTLSELGIILKANFKAAKMLGEVRSHLVNRRLTKFIFPADQDIVNLHRQTLFAGGIPQAYQLRMVKNDGSFFWVHMEANLVQDVERSVFDYQITLSDITLRKQGEEALRQSEERYRLMTDNAPLAIAMTSPESGEVLYANPRMFDFFGMPSESLLGSQALTRYSNPQDRTRLMLLLQAYGQVTDYELRLKKGDGREFWASLTANLTTYDGRHAIQTTCIDITERKAAEESLRIKDRAFAASINAIAIADLSGQLTYVNPAFLSMWGYEQESEVLGLPITAFWQQPEKAVEIASVLISGKNWEGELTAQQKDGSLFEAQLSAAPVLDDYGQPLCMLAIFVDLSERIRAEKALQASHEKLELLFDLLPVGVSVLDHEHNLVKSNAALESILGISAEGLLRGDYLNRRYFNPDGSQMESAEYASSRIFGGERQALHIETGVEKEDGDMVWTDVSAAKFPFTDWNTVIVTADISQRKRVEQALSESEQNLQNVFATIRDAIFVVDAQYRLLNCNQAFQDAVRADLGYEMALGEMVLKPEYPREFQDLWQKNYARALAGETISFEAQLERSDGIHYIENTLSPMLDSEKKVSGVLVVSHDFTERKRAIAELINARKVAETLAAGVAHELNSPLQVITGYSESLLKAMQSDGKLEGERAERQLTTLKRNAWRVAEIVRLLQHSVHPERGSTQQISLNKLVQDTLILMDHQIRANEYIEVVTELAEDLPLLSCDQNKIIQMLINLLTNACDALPYGGKISIHTAYQAAPERLLLKIMDSGKGIPESIRPRIFDPFFTTKQVGDGLGLGLSIVQGIVRAHGGEIQVESDQGKGTTFTISLPLVSGAGSSPGSDASQPKDNPLARYDD